MTKQYQDTNMTTLDAPAMLRVLDALASDCDNTDSWEDAAPTVRWAISHIEALTKQVAELRSAAITSHNTAMGEVTEAMIEAGKSAAHCSQGCEIDDIYRETYLAMERARLTALPGVGEK